jgi:divalent metal cation (Fe/Co/Zn/Cd) transporter
MANTPLEPAAAPTASCGVESDCCTVRAPSGIGSPQWRATVVRVKALSWFSLAWMTAEGVLGLVAGLAAGSISLVGWALGSAIEGGASVIVIWRLTGSRTTSEVSEARARKAVAVSFFLLAPYVAAEAIRDLVVRNEPHATLLGIGVTGASLLVMPILGVTKRRLARTLASGAAAGEGLQNLMCAAQGGAVLLGLAAVRAFGWSWVDPVVALGLAAWAVREGVEAWHGEDCC